MQTADIVVIGTGAGGGTFARAIAGSGARVVVLERGIRLPREVENWSPEAVFLENRYKANEVWEDGGGRPFRPGVHYWVGGNTKVYGAVLHRMREEDFGDLEHEGGTSPAWPISYNGLEPYYGIAERWYLAHGKGGIDPTEPYRSIPYPFPPVPHDAYMRDLAGSLENLGLHPYPMPLGLEYFSGGRCIRCRTCDAFPCRVGAKADAECCGVDQALGDPNIELWTGATARRLLTDSPGRKVTGVELERGGAVETLSAGTVVVACGAVNSATLLLRSATSTHPGGLANRSGRVGRNYMVHNNAVLMAVHPTRINSSVVQKSISINDFYFRGPGFPWPMGNLQPVGKVHGAMLKSAIRRVSSGLLGQIAARSTDWWVMSEDLPDPENRVKLTSDGKTRIRWKPTNAVSHRRFIEVAKHVFREAGYPVVATKTMGIETNSHMVGTLRFGVDEGASVLDPWCKAHDHDNLYVVDASFFPSSSAVNPALTIMAQSIRVADHLTGRDSLSIERDTA
ncbi:GMC family oxidoreductase [soil metagenome]